MSPLTITCMLSLTLSSVSGVRVIVSGYSSLIATFSVTDDQLLVSDGRWVVGEENRDMTWLQVNGDIVYGGHEVGEYQGQVGGAISKWRIVNEDLLLEDWALLPSPYPAHILVNREDGVAYTANYGGNSFTALEVDKTTGDLGEVIYQEMFGENCRDLSHPHQTVTYKQWIWVVDLGCDTIWHYKLNSVGDIEKLGFTSVSPGSGPRHMVVIPGRGLVALAAELESKVILYRLDESTGGLELVQEVELSSDPADTGAEILLSPDEKFLFVSSRGRGVVVVYMVDQMEDRLERVQELNLAGIWPRHMVLYGDMMVVVDQFGDSIQVLYVDLETGLLAGGPEYSVPSQPSYVTVIE